MRNGWNLALISLYGYDANGNVTFTVSDIVNVAPNIEANAIFRDQQGNCYLAGGATSKAAGGTVFGFRDAGIAKFTSTGSLVYVAYFGGNPAAGGNVGTGAIAVDSAGNAYVVGLTSCPDFPLQNPIQNLLKGTGDAFILKLDPTGTHLLYSTYFGSNTTAFGIAADSGLNAYIIGGITSGGTIPTTSGAFQTAPKSASALPAFVAKISPTGTEVYGTYLGGSTSEAGAAIAVDGAGSAYAAGSTSSTDFPTKNAFQTSLTAGRSGFLSKLSADGSALVYSTYFGGSDPAGIDAIAVDGNGSPYVVGNLAPLAGSVPGANFPLANPIQSEFLATASNPASPTPFEVFVAAFNDTGSALQYSTFFGGFDSDVSFAMGLDSSDNVYFAGAILGFNGFPIINASQGKFQPLAQVCAMLDCTIENFLARISPTGGTALASPASVDFGAVLLPNTTFPLARILIANVGPTDLTINNTSISGDYKINSNTCTGTLLSAKHCETDVIFTPTAGGTRAGVLTLTSTAPDSPRNIQLTGIGGVPIVSLSSNALNLTSPKVGAAGPTQTVTLTNTGLDVLEINSLQIIGPNAADFGETHNCASTLAAGLSCNVNIAYTASTSNAESATLQITDNAAGSPHAVVLTGVISAFGLTLASGGSATATVSAGQTATYNLMVGGQGFSGTVSLSCSGAPMAATCTVPNSENLSSTPTNFQATVSTTARSSLTFPPASTNRIVAAPVLVLLLGLPVLLLIRNHRPLRILSLAGAFLSLLLMTSCGGGGGNSMTGSTGTPAGTYTLTVTATNGGNTQNMNLTLNVN